jgi:hypothetical protein
MAKYWQFWYFSPVKDVEDKKLPEVAETEQKIRAATTFSSTMTAMRNGECELPENAFGIQTLYRNFGESDLVPALDSFYKFCTYENKDNPRLGVLDKDVGCAFIGAIRQNSGGVIAWCLDNLLSAELYDDTAAIAFEAGRSELAKNLVVNYNQTHPKILFSAVNCNDFDMLTFCVLSGCQFDRRVLHGVINLSYMMGHEGTRMHKWLRAQLHAMYECYDDDWRKLVGKLQEHGIDHEHHRPAPKRKRAEHKDAT